MSLQTGSVDADGLARTSDGKLYVKVSGDASITGGNTQYVLLQSQIPFILPASGTMADNGAFTNGTALARTVSKCFMYFAANQIAAGVAAGWYYTEGSSTTAFIVYNNTYTSGIPAFPAAKTAFAVTGAGATTGVTTEIVGPTMTLTGGRMGTRGRVDFEVAYTCTNNANAKTARHRLATTSCASISLASAASFKGDAFFGNVEDEAVQFGGGELRSSAATIAASLATTGAVNTAVDVAVNITLQHSGAATDNVALDAFRFLVCNAA